MKHKKLLSLIIILLSFVMISSCSTSGRVIGAVKIENETEKSMTYTQFDGTKKYAFKVEDDEQVSVKVSVVSKSGKLDAYIAKDNDRTNAVYEGNDIKTSSFSVNIKEPGKYTIFLKGDAHEGGYKFIIDKLYIK